MLKEDVPEDVNQSNDVRLAWMVERAKMKRSWEGGSEGRKEGGGEGKGFLEPTLAERP